MWVAGFDIIYALQDMSFDIKHNLHSLPSRFGINFSLWCSRLSFVVTCAALIGVGWLARAALYYWLGLAVCATILCAEQFTLKYNLDRKALTPQKMNQLFFHANAVMSACFLLAVALDAWIK